jgi:hypothetical protein
MVVKTETSPRTEAAPFSDREKFVKEKVKKRSKTGRSMLPSRVEPSTAENVPVRGRDLCVMKASIPTNRWWVGGRGVRRRRK